MGGQYHHELIRYCPSIYVLCVSSHFLPFTIVKFVLEKFDKNMGLGQTPLFGTKSQNWPKICFMSPLIVDTKACAVCHPGWENME